MLRRAWVLTQVLKMLVVESVSNSLLQDPIVAICCRSQRIIIGVAVIAVVVIVVVVTVIIHHC